MQHWKTALLTLVIFGLGGLTGSLITAHVIKSKIEHAVITQPPPGMHTGDFIPLATRVMEKQLNLSSEQTVKVREVMKRAQQEVMRLNAEWRQKAAEMDPGSPALPAARNEWRVKSREVMTKSDEAVRRLLTPEQFPLFNDFLRKRRTLFMQDRPNDLPPRPSGIPGDRLPAPARAAPNPAAAPR